MDCVSPRQVVVIRLAALVTAVGVAVALALGAEFEWKWVLAPFLGLSILSWALATFRSFAPGANAVGAITGSDEPQDLRDADERTLYWCETCGAELLLLVRGSTNPPRHCGERMHERVEIAR